MWFMKTNPQTLKAVSLFGIVVFATAMGLVTARLAAERQMLHNQISERSSSFQSSVKIAVDEFRGEKFCFSTVSTRPNFHVPPLPAKSQPR